MKLGNEVLSTTNYQIFKTITANRPVDENHLRKIIQSMRERYTPTPILVNGKYEVIDGQHRLRACRELKLPLYYIKTNGGIEDVQRINSNSKDWTNADRARSYAESGNFNYSIFIAFKEKYGFGVRECVILLSGMMDNEKAGDKFRNGQFVVKSLKQAETNAEKLLLVAPYYKGFKRRSFVLAMLKLFENPEYDHKVFVSKLKMVSTKMVDCVNIADYTKLIEEIYNYRNKTKIRLF